MARRGKQTSAYCEECDTEWFGPNALANGRRHAERQGHEVQGLVQHLYLYGPEVHRG